MNQKHFIVRSPFSSGMVVSRIRNLFSVRDAFKGSSPGCVWLQQGQLLREIDCRRLCFKRQLALTEASSQSLSPEDGVEFEGYAAVTAVATQPKSLGAFDGPLWILVENKYLYLNDRFIGVLPFKLRFEAICLSYSDSLLLICEEYAKCHLIEINEFYNIENHQEFTILQKQMAALNEETPKEYFCPEDEARLRIHDCLLRDDVAFLATSYGLTKIDLFAENKSSEQLESQMDQEHLKSCSRLQNLLVSKDLLVRGEYPSAQILQLYSTAPQRLSSCICYGDFGQIHEDLCVVMDFSTNDLAVFSLTRF